MSKGVRLESCADEAKPLEYSKIGASRSSSRREVAKVKLSPNAKATLVDGIMRRTVTILRAKDSRSGQEVLVVDEIGRESWVQASQLEPPVEWVQPTDLPNYLPRD